MVSGAESGEVERGGENDEEVDIDEEESEVEERSGHYGRGAGGQEEGGCHVRKKDLGGRGGDRGEQGCRIPYSENGL